MTTTAVPRATRLMFEFQYVPYVTNRSPVREARLLILLLTIIWRITVKIKTKRFILTNAQQMVARLRRWFLFPAMPVALTTAYDTGTLLTTTAKGLQRHEIKQLKPPCHAAALVEGRAMAASLVASAA